ncbi:hypothetical protein QF205_04740 [Luteimonas composti]|uniref:DUF2029 domain-containing protein n=1 Tax=Luteimonas composti TaxID=398257 RepID=A0ABT6MP93_9GAMM|nr:hypothetical protein [Luteimonas composti]MDH7452393.1 hypothetical protein [Luteimonas composti]
MGVHKARPVTTGGGEAPQRLTLLWGATLLLALAAPLALWSSRVPGVGELDYLIFYRLLFFNDLTASAAMLGGLALATLIRPVRRIAAHLASAASARPMHAAGVAFVLLAVCALIVYQRFPLAMDEYAPVLQARIFASGELTAQYPVELLDYMVPPGFQGYFVLANPETGHVASAYWPGLALLMTPFALMGAEWLLNPLLGALGLLLLGDLSARASGRPEARGWAMLAALASPQYTVSAISFYAMTGVLTFNLLFVWLLLRPGTKWAFLAGVAGSVALTMHNPLPHALVAAACMPWLIFQPERRRALLAIIAGYLPLAAILGLGWPLLTSELGMRAHGLATDLGFFSGWMQKFRDMLVWPSIEMLRLRSYAAWKMLIWSAPGLLLVAFLARPRTAVLRLFLVGFLVTYIFYFFVPFDQGHGWGFRYIHPAWGFLPVAAGVFAACGGPKARAFVACAIAGGLIATPVFMQQTHRTIASSISLQPEGSKEGHGILLVTYQQHLYTGDLVRNYPSDFPDRIMMLSTGSSDHDAELVASIAPDAELMHADHRGAAWQASEKQIEEQHTRAAE